MSSFVGFGAVPIAPPIPVERPQATSGGIAMVDQGNVAQRLVSPAGTSRGLSLRLDDDAVWPGRVSFAMVGAGLLVITALYVWTRSVQGGG